MQKEGTIQRRRSGKGIKWAGVADGNSLLPSCEFLFHHLRKYKTVFQSLSSPVLFSLAVDEASSSSHFSSVLAILYLFLRLSQWGWRSVSLCLWFPCCPWSRGSWALSLGMHKHLAHWDRLVLNKWWENTKRQEESHENPLLLEGVVNMFRVMGHQWVWEMKGLFPPVWDKILSEEQGLWCQMAMSSNPLLRPQFLLSVRQTMKEWNLKR